MKTCSTCGKVPEIMYAKRCNACNGLRKRKERKTGDFRKVCVSCNAEKDSIEFHRCALAFDGRQKYCKNCSILRRTAWRYDNHAIVKGQESSAHRKKVMARFGIDEKWYDDKMAAQNYCCPICTEKFQPGKGRHAPVIDHDHETEEARGILCRVCNSSIGLLGDSVAPLERAAAYLKSFSRATHEEEASEVMLEQSIKKDNRYSVVN